MPVRIDAHHHVWELSRRPQHWLDPPRMAALRRAGLTPDERADVFAGTAARAYRLSVQGPGMAA